MKRLAGIVLLAAAVSQAQTQAPDPAAAEPIRRYAVEVIVFRYLEDVSVGSEIFPPDEPAVEATDPVFGDRAMFLDRDGNPLAPASASDEETLPAVPAASDAPVDELQRSLPVLMLGEEFTLKRAAEQLERLDAYEPVLHIGWTQAAYGEAETPPIELPFFGQPVPGLEGSFTLYLERYLHLVVDLALEDAAAPGAAEPVDFAEPEYRFGDSRRVFDAPPAPGAVRYRISENRILKNGEIRYFDHPRFGVIAKVTRVDTAGDGG